MPETMEMREPALLLTRSRENETGLSPYALGGRLKTITFQSSTLSALRKRPTFPLAVVSGFWAWQSFISLGSSLIHISNARSDGFF